MSALFVKPHFLLRKMGFSYRRDPFGAVIPGLSMA